VGHLLILFKLNLKRPISVYVIKRNDILLDLHLFRYKFCIILSTGIHLENYRKK